MANAVYGSVLSGLSEKPGRPILTHQGGVAYEVDALTRARRFFILGTDTNSFYVGARELTLENAKSVIEAIDAHGTALVDLIVEVAKGGLAPKQDALMMGLALAASSKDDQVRRAALAAIPVVCGYGTALFDFTALVQTMRGWGRGLRNAIGKWYLDKTVEQLVYQAIKYRQRDGWTHADVLRLAHPVTEDPIRKALFNWIVDGEFPEGFNAEYVLGGSSSLDQLYAFESLQETDDKATVLRLIQNFRLPFEAVPTKWHKDPDVWEVLLQDMPMGAMIRNIKRMTQNGLLTTRSDATKLVVERLNDAQWLRKSKIHPIKVLEALKTYAFGYSRKSGETWVPIPKIIDALDDAFYGTFPNVVPTNRDILVAVDTSGSMSTPVVGTEIHLSTSEAAAAMALILVATEPYAEVVAFDTRLHHPRVSAKQRLDDATRALSLGGGGTHCHLPFQYALDSGRSFDAIVMYTDNANGGRGVYETLDKYRAKVNRNTRLVTAAMAAYSYSLAKPSDHLALDVVGFDPSIPNLIAGFVRGQV